MSYIASGLQLFIDQIPELPPAVRKTFESRVPTDDEKQAFKHTFEEGIEKMFNSTLRILGSPEQKHWKYLKALDLDKEYDFEEHQGDAERTKNALLLATKKVNFTFLEAEQQRTLKLVKQENTVTLEWCFTALRCTVTEVYCMDQMGIEKSKKPLWLHLQQKVEEAEKDKDKIIAIFEGIKDVDCYASRYYKCNYDKIHGL